MNSKATLRDATAFALLAIAPVVALEVNAASDLDACIIEAFATADDSTSVADIRKACAAAQDAMATGDTTDKQLTSMPVYEQSNVVLTRYEDEAAVRERPFSITPSRPNYILYTVMDDANQAPFLPYTDDPSPVQDEEMQFQVSIKAPVWRHMFGTNLDTYVSYTARSQWQLFNDDFSSPFRETNYEPEIYIQDYTDYDVLGLTVTHLALGFNHQSNGQVDRYSRSWNRIMAKGGLSITDDLALFARAWYRIPEDDDDDDNPNMYRYFGYGDVRAIWAPNRNTFTAMLRPGTEHTSFELTWSYPISKVFRIYAQYYNGYGETLLDYAYDMERFGIGIALNDYLQRH